MPAAWPSELRRKPLVLPLKNTEKPFKGIKDRKNSMCVLRKIGLKLREEQSQER